MNKDSWIKYEFTVNGKKVDVPSYILKADDVISVRERSRKVERIKEAMETAKQRGIPSWLELNIEQFEGKVVSVPEREEITTPIKEQLIVELYSK